MYEEQLKELGLTDNEVRIYLILLQHGAMSAYEISQKLGLHRGYVYDALERMQEKEVANFVFKNNKKHFQASSPNNILQLLKFKLENFQKSVSGLNSLMNVSKEDTHVEVHKGKRAFKFAMKDIISTVKQDDEVLILSVDEKISIEECGEAFFKQYFSSLKKKKVKERVIVEKGAYKLSRKFTSRSITQYKEVEEKYIGNTAQFVYGNKISLFIHGIPSYMIIIENAEVAETHRRQFELLWSIAK